MAYVAQSFQAIPVRDKPDTLGRLRRAVSNYRKFRKAYEELDALSDRELADIGVSRHDIREIAREAAYGN